ncbi:MAG: putative entry exclusion protein TrbK-alt [Alphaproteobacteria bacterium]|nr:putative entry exclusion protein TrbK-alt [Alphaproteobacteria bacterium]MBU0792605.1 putative entry exclusion protein TrbK-alt [Alphaproteobacteria bacterium]MBU0876749.1 putative entry exclusion protein TrbK-alt [Alphaproteobacteria bacterium]MBU1768995.1 putative entry exclusion protein TrbK-alt [Alphaproteobacteria bacterium]
MGRTTKVAGVAALAGMMVTVGIVSVSQPEPTPAPVKAAGKLATASSAVDLRRCRTITMPEIGCEAAWEAKRRHFFGRDDKQ